MVKEIVKSSADKHWFAELPSHWDTMRLKNISALRFSNVDKLTSDDEIPVLLCNYLDVYKNDYITSEIEFMKASASIEEIRKFKLEKGDVLVTKDSETASDIAVPAFVEIEADNLISGYHLAQIKPNKDIVIGEYLFHLFQSKQINSHFEINATGVTRYGLSIDSFASALLPIPPLEEQLKIVTYIKGQSEKISRFLQKKQRLIELLKEQKQSIANRHVTNGIYPNVAMKTSGIDWLGDIPSHWNINKCKNVYSEIDIRSTNGEEELLSVSHYDGVSKRSSKNVTMFMAEDYSGYKLCWPGDLVINILWAWMGALGISNEHGIVSSAYGVYRLKQPKLYNTEFLDLMLRHQGYITEYFKRSKGVNSSRARMYSDDFFTVPIITPPVDEQTEIVATIKQETRIINIAIGKAEKEIELMKEYREAMIAEAVMGKTL